MGGRRLAYTPSIHSIHRHYHDHSVFYWTTSVSEQIDLRPNKILGAIKVLTGKTGQAPFAQANTQQLRAHLLPLTEIDHHPNFHTGALFRRPTSMPQAGTSGVGLSIIPFLVSLSGLTSGTLLHLQSTLTVMPHVRIYYTTFFSSQQREMY